MKASKVLVLPSLTESWGNVAMEAMALGVPVVVSDIEGLMELTDTGKYGLTFKCGDPEDLVDKLRLVLKNETVRSKYSGSRVANYIQKTFTMSRRTKELLQLYEKVRAEI